MREITWSDEAEQQLSRIAPSACDISEHVHILGAGLLEVLGMDPLSYV